MNENRPMSIKNSTKLIKDLYLKPQTLKLLEVHMDITLYDISIGKEFLTRIPFAQKLWPTIVKWDLMN